MNRIFLLFSSCVFLLSCGPKSATAPPELVVGMLAPKTGIMAPHGESMEMGVQVAAQTLNSRGGVLGKNVRVVVLDTQSDPAAAAQRARELIGRDKVSLLLGTGLSSETLAVIPISTGAKVPFIYSMDGECKTCAIGNPQQASHFVWGAGFTERMVVKPFLSYLADQVLPKHTKSLIYLLGGDYVYPRATNEFARTTAEAMGFKIIGDEYTDVSTTDYTPVIRRIMNSKADLLLVTNPGSAAATFMRQAQQLGLPKRMLISGFATFAQEAVGEMGTASEGVVYANRYTDLLPGQTNADFVAAFRSKYPGKPLLPGPTVAAGGYGALMVGAAAFQKAGTTTDPEAFYQAMRGLKLDLPQGEIVVDPDNNIFRQNMYLLKVSKQKYEVIGNLGQQTHPGFEGCSVK
jgi:ABC-type branched-subunit amino acid transport system substrate-binding protein